MRILPCISIAPNYLVSNPHKHEGSVPFLH
jgi:hypothetical protein